jgi:hypothetical protein
MSPPTLSHGVDHGIRKIKGKRGPRKAIAMSGDIEEEAPPEVHHYSNRGEVPWDIQKYNSCFLPLYPTGFYADRFCSAIGRSDIRSSLDTKKASG